MTDKARKENPKMKNPTRRRRFFAAAAAFFIAAAALSGCSDKIEIRDRLIVQAVGFDYYDGMYHVTLQYFFQASSEANNNLGTSSSNSRTITGVGQSITDAVNQIAVTQGDEVFYGKNNILIVGSGFTGKPLEGLVDFFIHDHKGRGNNMIFAAENKAQDILEINISGALVTAESIEHSVIQSQKMGICPIVRLVDFQNGFYGRANAAALPYLRISHFVKSTADSEKEELNPNTLFVSGMKVYRNFFHAGDLSPKQSELICVLTNRFETATQTVHMPAYKNVVVGYSSGWSKITYKGCTENNERKFLIELSLKGYVAEMEETSSGFDLARLPELYDALESDLTAKIGEFLQFTLKDMQTDLLELNDKIYRKAPASLKNGKADLTNTSFDISISLNIEGADVRSK